MKDNFSKRYFEKFSPNYSLDNFSLIVDYLRGKKRKDILDVGCGDGRSLEVLNKYLNADVFGLEEAEGYKIKMKKNLAEKIFWMSILDGGILKKVNRKFDAVIISRVLHHLVSQSPQKSKELSCRAIRNAFKLTQKGGEVIISEPIFEPACLNSFVFYIKKFFSRITRRRVTLFGHWNNIGEPLVSYFTINEIKELAHKYNIVEFKLEKYKSTFLINFFFKRLEVFVVLRRK